MKDVFRHKKGLFGHGSKQSSWKRKTESFDYRSWSSVKKCRHLKDTESAPIDWHESVSSLLQDNRSKLPLEICCLCSSCTLTRYLDLVVEVCLPGSMPIEKAIFPALSSQHGCEQICKRAI